MVNLFGFMSRNTTSSCVGLFSESSSKRNPEFEYKSMVRGVIPHTCFGLIPTAGRATEVTAVNTELHFRASFKGVMHSVEHALGEGLQDSQV